MAEKPNPLVQGIADAIAGGALAGLSKEAGMDFFSPFIQAQQRRIKEGQQRGKSAFTNYSTASDAALQAFASNPLGEGRYQASVDNAEQRLQMALENIEDPAARDAVVQSHQAHLGQLRGLRDQGLIQRHVELGARGDFSWMTSQAVDDTILQASIEAMTADNSVIMKNYGEWMKLADRIQTEPGTEGQFAEGIGEFGLFEGPGVTQEQRRIAELVKSTGGGLQSWSFANREEAAFLLGKLETTNPQTISNMETALQNQENATVFRGKLAQASKSVKEDNFLIKGNLYELSDSGVVVLTTDTQKLNRLRKDLTEAFPYAGDLAKHLDRVQGLLGVDMGRLRTELVPDAQVREVSSEYTMKEVVHAKEDAMGMVSFEGPSLFNKFNTPANRRAMLTSSPEEAAQRLVDQGLPEDIDPLFAVEFLRNGGAAIREATIEAAFGVGEIDQRLKRLADEEAQLQAVGKLDDIAKASIASKREALLQVNVAGQDDIKDIHRLAIEAATENTMERYEELLKRTVAPVLTTGFSFEAVSESYKSRLKTIQSIEDPVERDYQFGRLLIEARYAENTNLPAASRELRSNIALSTLRKRTNAIRAGGAMRVGQTAMIALGTRGDTSREVRPLENIYRFMAMSAEDIANPPSLIPEDEL